MGPARRWRGAWLGLCLAASALVTPGPGRARADAPARCAAVDGWRFLCDAQGAEDIVAVPGSRWLIASALNLGHPTTLSLIDGSAKTATPLAFAAPPHAGRAEGCPGQPDPARISTDGLALRQGRGGVHLLYAANHGDRRAIEMFRLDARGARPTLTWQGCALLPAHTLPNAVAPLPNGGVLAVSFHDPDDPGAWRRMAQGEPTGEVLEWHPGTGFRSVAGSAMSGGNGIALSPDGAVAYVSAWSGRSIIALPLRPGRARRSIPLPFLPDNIHALSDGSLLVAGQRTNVAAIGRCSGLDCPQPWIVARVDPIRGTVSSIAEGQGGDLIDYACGALVRRGTLYLTSRGRGGIAYRETTLR